MIRRLDNNGDWTFGSGKGSYLSGAAGLRQRLETQLKEWMGDCFFALQRGIPWHLMDRKTSVVERVIRMTLMKSPEVLRINSLEVEKSDDRLFKPRISIETIYGEDTL